MSIKYPRYPNNLNLKKKLTPEQIEGIRNKRLVGYTLQGLANEYGVSVFTIYWHCLPKEARVEKAKSIYSLYNKRTAEQRKISAKKFNERKKKLMPKELSAYWKEKAKYYKSKP